MEKCLVVTLTSKTLVKASVHPAPTFRQGTPRLRQPRKDENWKNMTNCVNHHELTRVNNHPHLQVPKKNHHVSPLNKTLFSDRQIVLRSRCSIQTTVAAREPQLRHVTP